MKIKNPFKKGTIEQKFYNWINKEQEKAKKKAIKSKYYTILKDFYQI